MKTRVKKSIAIAAVLGVALVAGITPTQAQETTTTSSSDSIVALAADSKSIPQVTSAETPRRGGTYWLVYPTGEAIPTPCLPLGVNVPIYGVTSQEFLVDMTGGTVLVTPRQLTAESQTANPYAAAVTGQVQGLMNLITFVQTPPPAATTTTGTTETAMTAGAKPMGQGFSPMYQSGVPYLTIAPTGTNGVFLVTVWNNQGPANYEIWSTPALVSYPWSAVAAGTTGQTNFYISAGTYYTGFYRAIWDTNSIPTWQAANNNPANGVLSVYIDSPTNGAVLQ
jgi:hypothetical protein